MKNVKSWTGHLYKLFFKCPRVRNRLCDIRQQQKRFEDELDLVGRRYLKKFTENRPSSFSCAQSILVAVQIVCQILLSVSPLNSLTSFLETARDHPLLFSFFCSLLSLANRSCLNFFLSANESLQNFPDLADHIDTQYHRINSFLDSQITGISFFVLFYIWFKLNFKHENYEKKITTN